MHPCSEQTAQASKTQSFSKIKARVPRKVWKSCPSQSRCFLVPKFAKCVENPLKLRFKNDAGYVCGLLFNPDEEDLSGGNHVKDLAGLYRKAPLRFPRYPKVVCF